MRDAHVHHDTEREKETVRHRGSERECVSVSEKQRERES